MIFVYWIIFLLFLITAVFPLGRYLLYLVKLDASKVAIILLSVALGLWGITLESYLFGITGLKNILNIFLTLQSIILIVFVIQFIKVKINLKDIKISLLAVFVILLSIFINSFITFPFGTFTNNGIRFAGAHMTDNNWHLSLIHSIQKSIPPEVPTFAGVNVKNYHYLVDLQIATIQSLTKIPLPELFYQIIGPFYIALYSCLAFLIGKLLTKKNLGGALLVLYTSLSGGWYYLARLFYPSAYNWPSVAWVDYFSSKSVNYPLLFSMILLFLVIYLFSTVKNKDLRFIVLLSLIIGSLMSVKSHTGVVVISSFFVLALTQIVNRDFLTTKIFLLSIFTGGLFMIPTINLKQSSLILYPFWFIKVMYEAPDRLNFSEWELKRQYLLSKPGYLGLIKLYLQGLSIFILINLNILLLGVLTLFQRIDPQFRKTIFLLVIISGNSFILTMLFIYKGIAIITIQFFYPAIVSLSVLLSIWIVSLYDRHKYAALLLACLIWVSLLPGVIFTIGQYSGRNVGLVELPLSNALSFLSKQPYGITLVDSVYSGNSLIPAYTDKSIFYADDLILDTLTIDYSSRKAAVKNFFECKNNKEMENFLLVNKIKYIFSAKYNCLDSLNNIKRIFSNSSISIYQSLI